MPTRFPREIVDAVRAGKILGVQAGTKPHRVIGIWMVVVEGRVFVRSWSLGAGGWHRAFTEEPRGTMHIDRQALPVRAVQTRSKRLKDAVSAAYREKYHTPASRQYVKDLNGARSRGTTTELVPR